MDANHFIAECNRKSPQDLAPYTGQWVAWSEDGKNVLASASDEAALYREVDRLGLAHYVVEFIPGGDEDFIGGGLR